MSKKEPVIIRKVPMKPFRAIIHFKNGDRQNFISNEYFILKGMDGSKTLVLYKYDKNIKVINTTEKNNTKTILPDPSCVCGSANIDYSMVKKMILKYIEKKEK